MRGEVDKLKILLALIFIFQGLHIAILSNPLIKIHEGLRLFGVLLMVMGILYIYFKYKMAKTQKEKAKPEEKITKVYKSTQNAKIKTHILKSKEKEPEEKSILTKFMEWSKKNTEVISPYMLPIIGAVVVDAVIIYNILINKSIDLKGFDTITILFGISLISYNYIPDQYTFARDFFVFFLGLLFFILVFPPIFYEQIIGSGGNATITKIFLGDPVVGLLKLGGIESSCSIVDTGSGQVATLFFPLAQTGKEASVGIAEACSGIYTASIFLSAFITFVLVEYKRFNLKVGLIIGLGIITTYLANILRMTIIVLIGYYFDTDPTSLSNLSWAHVNAGWLIFMAWIIPFWFLMYRFLMSKDIGEMENKSKN